MSSKSPVRMFLDEIAFLERALRRIIGAEEYVPLTTMIGKAAQVSRIVAENQEFLRDVASLRNAIVHNPSIENRPLADPHEWVSSRLIEVRALIESPPRLMPTFRVNVVTRLTTDSLADVVADMWHGDFSQVPIYRPDRTFVEVLTTETIVRWMSQNPGRPWQDVAVLDALSYTEDPDHFAFLSTESSVVEAVELFDQFAHRGKYLDALLITRHGDVDRIPEGIITQFDLPVLYQMTSVMPRRTESGS